MTKKIVIAALIVAIIGLGIYFWPQLGGANTPQQNKQIEIEAFSKKDLAMCDTIKGSSYMFGPNDGRIEISEEMAVQKCVNNINQNIQPVEFGG